MCIETRLFNLGLHGRSLVFGRRQAADKGPLKYAEGQYEAASGAYTVVKSDDLAAIAERFGVTVARL
ncbi:MAG: LysM domain-containing protein [Candidatus Competibacteraceae bacterium]|nr:LysM domain-containing protein [Candidatus Competibacteraceae bacterium]